MLSCAGLRNGSSAAATNGVERQNGFRLVRELTFENFLVESGVHLGATRSCSSSTRTPSRWSRFRSDLRSKLRNRGSTRRPFGRACSRPPARADDPCRRAVPPRRRSSTCSGLHPKKLEIEIALSKRIAAGPRARRLVWPSGEALRTTFVFRALRVGRAPVRVVAQTNGFPADQLILYASGK